MFATNVAVAKAKIKDNKSSSRLIEKLYEGNEKDGIVMPFLENKEMKKEGV